jgi:phage baseplate assembly protein W
MENNFRYKDIDLSMKRDSIKGDIVPLIDAEAVKNSVKNLILISIFERRMNPWVGTLIYTQLFENFTPKTSAMIRKFIRDVLAVYEPRVELRNVTVNQQDDQNFLEVNVTFSVINLPEIYSVSIFLERLR